MKALPRHSFSMDRLRGQLIGDDSKMPGQSAGTCAPSSRRSRSRGGLGSMVWPWRLQQCRARQGFDVHRQPGHHEVDCLSPGCERLVGSP